MTYDLLRDAAEEQMGQTGAPERSHDDHRRAAGRVENRLEGVPDDDTGGHPHAAARDRAADERLETFALAPDHLRPGEHGHPLGGRHRRHPDEWLHGRDRVQDEDASLGAPRERDGDPERRGRMRREVVRDQDRAKETAHPRRCSTFRVALVLLALGVPAGATTRDPRALDVRTGERLLVVAPHPDDETIGAGGLAQRVLARGGSVRVALLTAGDGYVEAVVHATGLPRPRPAEYIAYGERRLAEARAAMRELGGNRIRLQLLGFPDGALIDLLHAFWRRSHPEPSPT